MYVLLNNKIKRVSKGIGIDNDSIDILKLKGMTYIENVFDPTDATKITTGGYYNSSGTWSVNVDYNSIRVDVKYKEKYYLSSNALAYNGWDAEGNFIKSYYGSASFTIDDTRITYITVPMQTIHFGVRMIIKGTEYPAAYKDPFVKYAGFGLEIEELTNLSKTYDNYLLGKEFQFALGSINLGTNENSASSFRIRTVSPVYFVKGERVYTKNSDYLVAGVLLNEDNAVIDNFDYTDSYVFTQNAYARLVIKNGVADEDFTVKVLATSYFLNVAQNSQFESNELIWSGKTWYAFGTSMTDTTTKAKYPQVVDELSGLIRTNQAIGGGGICPTASHGGNVKALVLACPYDVDLVTLECGLNDWGSVPLGTIGDTGDNTFLGNLYQCLNYLTNNTRARVVTMTMTPTVFETSDQTTRRSPFFTNTFGLMYRQYTEAVKELSAYFGVPCIDVHGEAFGGGRLNSDTVDDTIHYTDLGGKICGEYVWDRLKQIKPIPHMPSGI